MHGEAGVQCVHTSKRRKSSSLQASGVKLASEDPDKQRRKSNSLQISGMKLASEDAEVTAKSACVRVGKRKFAANAKCSKQNRSSIQGTNGGKVTLQDFVKAVRLNSVGIGSANPVCEKVGLKKGSQ